MPPDAIVLAKKALPWYLFIIIKVLKVHSYKGRVINNIYLELYIYITTYTAKMLSNIVLSPGELSRPA